MATGERGFVGFMTVYIEDGRTRNWPVWEATRGHGHWGDWFCVSFMTVYRERAAERGSGRFRRRHRGHGHWGEKFCVGFMTVYREDGRTRNWPVWEATRGHGHRGERFCAYWAILKWYGRESVGNATRIGYTGPESVCFTTRIEGKATTCVFYHTE
jgi:hypothetical protein